MPVPPASHSLIHYDNPILFSMKTSSKSNKTQIPQTEDILNSIIPPREFDDEGQRWIQYVSPDPATRLNVINLQDNLDKKLIAQNARETGICPIRENLYSQAFDEVIRQVTVNCAERGLLLLRVRDEIRMTVEAYRTLYESSVAFGMRKALHAAQNKADMEMTIQSLEQEKEELASEIAALTAKSEAIEKREALRRTTDAAKHAEEIALLKKTEQTLTTNLQMIINPGKR
eukprot:Tbor_TRINITY_DN3122_c0_g1::TRINITY_DN3122_c0_g1_i1::g.14714::m.14714/K10410/DNALI; dynein light intermediate chain, axonemal